MSWMSASELWQNRNSSEFVLSTLIKLNQDQNFTVPRPRRLLYDLLALYENSEEIVSQLLDLILNSKHTLSGDEKVLLSKFLDNSIGSKQILKIIRILTGSASCVDIERASPRIFNLLIQIFNESECNKDSKLLLETVTLIYQCVTQLEDDVEYSLLEPIFLRMLEHVTKPLDPFHQSATVKVFQTLNHIILYRSEAIRYLGDNFEYIHTVISLFEIHPTSMRAIHNIFSHDDHRMVDKILKDTLYFREIKKILNTPPDINLSMKMEIFWGLSNVVVGEPEHLEIVIRDEEIMASVESHVKDACRLTKKEILILLCNISYTENANFWLDINYLDAILDTAEDESVHRILRDFLANILKQGESLVDNETIPFNPITLKIFTFGGVEKIEKQIKGTQKIVEHFFGEQLEEYLAKRRGLNTKRALH